ncbi:MAG: hypothetical protein ACJ8CB_24095 [Ktedonobacteraceae bacterium]
MTSIDRTIYRRMKRCYTTKELIEAYTPTEEERSFVSTMTRTVQNQLNLMLWIVLLAGFARWSTGVSAEPCSAA